MISGDYVDIYLAKPKRFAVTVWLWLAAFVAKRRKNSDGPILHLRNCISLRYDYYDGWRNTKLLQSGRMRKIRDCCIFRINDIEVFL